MHDACFDQQDRHLQLVECFAELKELVALELVVLELFKCHGEEVLDALDKGLIHQSLHLLVHILFVGLGRQIVHVHPATTFRCRCCHHLLLLHSVRSTFR